MNQLIPCEYHFGPYKLNTSDRVLLRDGYSVALTPKIYETLLVLVESKGRVVDKDELLSKIWPDTFVEEINLAKNVSTLRKILSEDHPHQYIETIPKRGYRFVAEVKENEGNDSNPVPSAGNSKTGNSSRWFWLIGIASIGLLAILMMWVNNRTNVINRGNNTHASELPVTSLRGNETQAAFSPDGKQIAFVWAESQNTSIYVKLIGDESQLRLTNSSKGYDVYPVWTPDGRSIIFMRKTPDSRAYYSVPALGGAERKLFDVYPYTEVQSGISSTVIN